MPLGRSFLLERLVGLAAQLRQRLCDLAGVGLDLGFELDRGFGEIGPGEGLVGGAGGMQRAENGRKGDERGEQADADGRAHGMVPPPPSAQFQGGDHQSTIPNCVEVVTEPGRPCVRVDA